MYLFQIHPSHLIMPDGLAWVMVGLILFILANVMVYSRRYLAGDRHRGRHQALVLLLAMSVIVMVMADHLLLLLAAWVTSNLLLVRLMIHKNNWQAAANSGRLALRTFGIGFVLLSAGFWLLAENAGTASISSIVENHAELSFGSIAGLFLISLAALTQTAAWPFYRWLISSLNSPTPVSALMHAGLVNGGGFLIVRFASLYASQPVLLYLLFTAGLITAVTGTFWKLMQTDIKRMLACSTIGQMGFMLMQCGMGLFAPAISHLCWHGLFKAYLFLSAGSVVREQRSSTMAQGLSPLRLVVALVAGGCGALAFTFTSGMSFSLADTRCVMIALAFMASSQLAIGLLSSRLTVLRLLCAIVVSIGAGLLYSLSIRLVETALSSLHALSPQPMNVLYAAGLSIMVVMWLAMLFNLPARLQKLGIWKWLYMAGLNASQPHPQTITATRTAYQS